MVAVVIGAARGIGRATALAFAHEGADVVAVVFLASDAARMVSGAIYAVTAGDGARNMA